MLATSVRVYAEADVKCFHCGYLVGLVRRDRAPVPTAPAFFPTGAATPEPVRKLSDIHCGRCCGPTFLDEVQVRHAVQLVGTDDEPVRRKRGRPPKHLTSATAERVTSRIAIAR
ncbi:MAG: hypothetical protein ACKVVP_16810 [Chloroflexota bacterium]